MRRRGIVLCALFVLVCLAARAQFIGDMMAAAGFAETEDELMLGLGSLSGDVPSPESTAKWSNGTPSESFSQPPPSAPLPPPVVVPDSAGSGTPSAPDVPGMPGVGGYAIRGSGKVYTPEEAADWKAS